MADQTYPNFVASRSSAGALLDADGVTIVRSGTTYKSTMSAIATYMAAAMAALTPQFTAIELGHATDTTISRVSAGRIAVEGSNVLMASDLAANVATFLATPSSANLAAMMTDETGSGANVFATSPTLVTPVLGVASATSINKVAITAPATGSTLTIADGKTLTASNTITFTATDGSTLAIGAGGTLGSAAYKATGTSGNTVPLLDGANTFSDVQIVTKTSAAAKTTPLTLRNSSGSSGTITELLFVPSTSDTRAAAIQASQNGLNQISLKFLVSNADVPAQALSINNDLSATFSGDISINKATATLDLLSSGSNVTTVAIRNGSRYDDIRNTSTGLMVRCDTSGTPKSFLFGSSGGFVVGSPTGGDKGVGTINGTAVYDDNVLLTDLVLDLAVAGSFDKVKYAKHPIANLVQPWWFDPDQYAEFWKANRYLPGMISWGDEKRRPSTGEVATRLTGVVETHAVLLANDNDRIKALQDRVAELEAKLAA